MKKSYWLLLIVLLIGCRRITEDITNNIETKLTNLIKENIITVGGVDEGIEIPGVVQEKGIQAWLIPIGDKPNDANYFVDSIDKKKASTKDGKLVLESPYKEGKYYLYTLDSQGKIEKNGDNVVTVDRKPMVEVVKTQVNGVSEFPTWNIKAKEYKKNNEKPDRYRVVVKEAGKIVLTNDAFKGTQFVYTPTTKNGLFEIEVEAYYKSFENIEKNDKLNPKKEIVVWSSKNFGGKIQVGDSNLNKPEVVTNPGDKDNDPTTVGPMTPLKPETITWPVGGAPTGITYEYTFKPVNVYNNQTQSKAVAEELAKVANPQKGTSYTPVSGLRDGEYVLEIVAIKDGVKSETTKVTYKVESAPTVEVAIPNTIIKVGEVLSASVTNYKDEAGDAQGPSTYQWYASGVAITNATGDKYTITENEIGKTITVAVIPTALTGYKTEGNPVSSKPTVAVPKIEQAIPVVGVNDTDNVVTGVKPGIVYFDGTTWKPLTVTALFPGDKTVRVKYAETPTYKESLEATVNFTRPKAPDAKEDDVNNILIDSKGNKVTTSGLEYRTHSGEDAWLPYDPTKAKFDGAVSVEIRVAERKNADGVLVETAGESTTVNFTDNEKPTKPIVVTNPGDKDNDPTTVGPMTPLKPETITWPVGGVPTGITYEYTFKPVSVYNNQTQSKAVAEELAKVANPQKGTSYTPVSGLRDGEYVLEIVAIKDGVKSETTKVTYKVESAPTVDVAISNTIIKVGETLNASVTNYKDEAGDEQGPSTYQWYANGVEIVDAQGVKATGSTYTITEKEIGKVITVGVIPTALTGYKLEGVLKLSKPTVAVPKLEQTAPVVGVDDTTNVVTGVKPGMVYFDGIRWNPLTDTTIFPGDKSVSVKYAETPTHKESAEVTVKFNRPAAPDAKKDDINNILIDSKGNKVTTSGLQYRTYASEDAWQTYDPAKAKFDGAISVEIRVAERKNADGVLVETAGESTTVNFTKDRVTLPLLKADDKNDYVAVSSTGLILNMNGLEYRTNTQIGSDYLPYNSTLRFTENVTVEIRVKGTPEVEESASQFVKFTKPIVYDKTTLQNIANNIVNRTGTIYRRSAGDIELNTELIKSHIQPNGKLPFQIWIAQTVGSEYAIESEKGSIFKYEMINGKYVIDAPINGDLNNIIIVYNSKDYVKDDAKVIVTNEPTKVSDISNKLSGKKGASVNIGYWDLTNSEQLSKMKELWIVPADVEVGRETWNKADYFTLLKNLDSNGNQIKPIDQLPRKDIQFEYAFTVTEENKGTRSYAIIPSSQSPVQIKLPSTAGKYKAYILDNAGNVSNSTSEFTVTN